MYNYAESYHHFPITIFTIFCRSFFFRLFFYHHVCINYTVSFLVLEDLIFNKSKTIQKHRTTNITQKAKKTYSHQHQAFDPMKSINPVIPVTPRFPVQTVSVSPDVVCSAAFLHSAPQNCPSTAVFTRSALTLTTPSPPAPQLCRVLLLLSRLSETCPPAFTFTI